MSYDKNSLNRVFLIGRLAKKPEIKFIPTGTAVSNPTLVTSVADKEGKETPEYHRLVVWGKQTELLEKYTDKGSRIFVEGKLQTRSWENKEGVKMYTTEIQVQHIQLLDSRKTENLSESTENIETGDLTDEDLPF